MPVSTPHSTGVHPNVLPQAPKGARGLAPATPATRPPVEPVARPAAASSSPPVEPHASNLTFGGAGLSQPAAPRGQPRAAARPAGSGRSGTTEELRLRFWQETEETEASTYEGVSFDLSLPAGKSWADTKEEFDQDYKDYQAARAKQLAETDSNPLSPTTSPSDTQNTSLPTRSVYDGVEFDVNIDLDDLDLGLGKDPGPKKEPLELNERHAPPPRKACPAPGESPMGRRLGASTSSGANPGRQDRPGTRTRHRPREKHPPAGARWRRQGNPSPEPADGKKRRPAETAAAPVVRTAQQKNAQAKVPGMT